MMFQPKSHDRENQRCRLLGGAWDRDGEPMRNKESEEKLQRRHTSLRCVGFVAAEVSTRLHMLKVRTLEEGDAGGAGGGGGATRRISRAREAGVGSYKSKMDGYGSPAQVGGRWSPRLGAGAAVFGSW